MTRARKSVRTTIPGGFLVTRPMVLFGEDEYHVSFFLVGLVFVTWAGAALFVARRWHGVRCTPQTALRAAAFVGLGQPLITLAAGFCVGLIVWHFRDGSWKSVALMYGTIAAASALGAWSVALAARLATGHRDRWLGRAMIVWAACWAGLQPLLERS